MLPLKSSTLLSSSIGIRTSGQSSCLSDDVRAGSSTEADTESFVLRKRSNLRSQKLYRISPLVVQRGFHDVHFYKSIISGQPGLVIESRSPILQKSLRKSILNLSVFTSNCVTCQSNATSIPLQNQFTFSSGKRSSAQADCSIQAVANIVSRFERASKFNASRPRHVCQIIKGKSDLLLLAQASETQLELSETLKEDLYSPAWYVGLGRYLVSVVASERAKVITMLAFALALCNADRVVMSVAIVPLSSVHHWSSGFSGVVQSSFLWGYLISPIPGGALADRYGGRTVLGWGVAIWSAATLATPWAANHSLGSLLATRSIMGLAEGVAMPCMNNIIARWFPRLERARAVSVSMAGFHLGSVGALLFTPLFMSTLGVSGPFIVFGLAGFFWLCSWLSAVPKHSQTNPRVRPREPSNKYRGPERTLQLSMETGSAGLPPFGLLLSKLPTWAIIVANAMNNWGYFILLSWMPVYFNTVLGVDLRKAAWFSAIPWMTMAVIGFVAGACSDFLIQSGVRVSMVRKIMQSIGFLGPAMALLRLNGQTNPKVAAIWLTTAVGLSAFSQAGFLVNHQEIGPRYAGVLHGLSNTAGTIAAIVSTVGTGYFIERLGSFQAFLTLTSVLYVLSTAFWVLYATGDEIFH